MTTRAQLAPDTAQAARLNLDAALLNEASQLDPHDLAEWADSVPPGQYQAALRIVAYLVLDEDAFAHYDCRTTESDHDHD
jgi:hypothetical protein